MDRKAFFEELRDILELDNEIVSVDSIIHLTSLSKLSIMAFIYENFEKQIKTSDLQNINKVKDLIDLIGEENIL